MAIYSRYKASQIKSRDLGEPYKILASCLTAGNKIVTQKTREYKSLRKEWANPNIQIPKPLKLIKDARNYKLKSIG